MGLSRREFFKISSSLAAGAGLAVSGGARSAEVGQTTLPYTPQPLGKAGALQSNTPIMFQFSGRGISLQSHQARYGGPGWGRTRQRHRGLQYDVHAYGLSRDL
jgi:hypothetical protein